jgi:phosphatidate cytidylyltransferase
LLRIDYEMPSISPSLFAVIAALFLLLIVITAFMRGSRLRSQTQLRAQVQAWWVFLPVTTAAVLLFPLGASVLSVIITLLGLLELSRFHAFPRAFRYMGISLCAAIHVCAVLPNTPALLATSTVIAIGLVCVVLLAAICRAISLSRQDMLNLFASLVVFGIGSIACFWQLPQPEKQLQEVWFYLFAITALNDICQFVSGQFWGRHKITPTISPNKTWEGLCGGVIGSALCSMLIGKALNIAPLLQLLALGVVLALTGFVGDLLFSWAKRQLAVKDFAQLIAGHGGILDRVDSLVLTAPMLFIWQALVH